MRKALIVGIDHYDSIASLSGCVNDAHSVKSVLERHADGTINFATPKLMTGTSAVERVDKASLKDAVRELFGGDADIALFYFAGHGYVEDTGGFLCGSECRTGDDGLALAEVMTLAGRSGAKNKVIILDSCHSGVVGSRPESQAIAEIKEGMTILTASTAEQYAMEVAGGGAGVFTSLFVDALGGAAANLVGDVTPGSVYAHIDQSLGPWAQRPVFKTNVKTFVSLRRAAAPIPLADLQALATHFPSPDYSFRLDPSYEPERSPQQLGDPSFPRPDPQKTAVFAVLQRYVKVNLVRPVGAPHMWHAAMQSKSCQLTVLGQHYRNLVANGLL
jgi:hypothetical protein